MKKNKNNLPNTKGNAVSQNISYREAFSGPIPPPNLLERYEEITPGAADRILMMAENQSKHRIEIEKKVIESKIIDSRIGVFLGFIVAMVVIVFGGILLLKGKSVQGYSTILLAVGGLVGSFVYGTRSNRKEREKKEELNQ